MLSTMLLSTKAIIGIFLAALVTVFGLRTASRLLKEGLVDTTSLSDQTEAVLAVWVSQGVFGDDRLLTIVLSDGADPTEMLLLPIKPPSSNRFIARLKGFFFPPLVDGREPDGLNFTQIVNQGPYTVDWTMRTYDSTSLTRTSEELSRVILMANDVGARVQIISSGRTALVTLGSIKRLQPESGGTIQVEKLISIE